MTSASWSLVVLSAASAALLACGGAAAPTATPTKAPAAAATPTAMPAAVPTPTRAAAALATPTPTLVATAAPRAAVGPVGKMTMAAAADVAGLDPYQISLGGTAAFYISDVYASLLNRLRLFGPPEPYLAESWAWDEKGLKVRFVIRKGAGFQNGKPVTADDIVFTVEKTRSPYTAASASAGAIAFRAKQVQAIDERTVVFTLREVLATGWSDLGALLPQPRHEPYELMKTKPIGAGPYRVADFRPFESMTMEASPYWWDADKVQVKTIVRLVVPETESRLAMLKAGQIDFMDEVQPRQSEELLKDKRFRVKVSVGGSWAPIIFSTDTPVIPGTDLPNPFMDVRVRRAFIMAVDRKAIFEGVALGKYGEYIPGPWASYGSGGSEEAKITPYPYDPKGARKLLEEAKFPFEREWPVWWYVTTAGYAESFEVAVAQWNAIGIKARGRPTEVSTLRAYWQEYPSRTYPVTMIRASLSGDGAPAGYVWCRKAKELPECVYGNVGDPRPDEWVIKLRTAFEPAEREQIYREVYRYTHEQALSIPAIGGANIQALSSRIDWDHVGGQSIINLWRTKWMPGYP